MAGMLQLRRIDAPRKELKRKLRPWPPSFFTSFYSPGRTRHSCIAPLVQGVMAVCIEPQTMAEGRLPHEVLFGDTLEVVEEPMVRFFQLSQDLGER